MSDPEKRICPFCAEAINLKAKLCPRCRQWLTWRSFRHPVVMVLFHLVPLTIIWAGWGILLLSMLSSFQNPKPYYSEFPNSLKILESRMNWVKTENGLCIYITGILTNTSQVTWNGTEFDCRFFDSHGLMIDAGTGRGYFTVPPAEDAAFRVGINPTAPTNEYASFKIFVSNARNAKGWFE